jgi:hypothetical protein
MSIILYKVGYDPVTIPNCQLDYDTTINLALVINESSDGTVKVGDYGSEYDYRKTNFQFHLTEDQFNDLEGFLENQSTGRLESFDFMPIAPYGVYPFGADLGNGQDIYYTTKLESFKFGTRLRRPYNKCIVDLGLHLCTTTGTYTIPTSYTKMGTVSILGLNNLPNPNVELIIDDHIANSTTLGGSLTGVDFKRKLRYVKSKLTFKVNRNCAANLIHELTTVRHLNFTLTTPSSCYPFGFEEGYGSFTVKLCDNKIKTKHMGKDLISVEFTVQKQ